MQAADYTILCDYNTKLNYFFRGNLEKNWRDSGFAGLSLAYTERIRNKD